MKINDFILQHKMYGATLTHEYADQSRIARYKMMDQLAKLSTDKDAEILPGGKGVWVFVLVNNKKIEKLNEMNAEFSLLAVNHNSIKVVDTANKENQDDLYSVASQVLSENASFSNLYEYGNREMSAIYLHKDAPAYEF